MAGNRYKPASEFSPFSKGWTWRLAGVWLVILALGLAVLGIIFSVQQASALTHRLMAQAETLAHLIAEQAEQALSQQIRGAVRDIRAELEGPIEARAVGFALPSWIDGVYLHSLREWRVIRAPNRVVDTGDLAEVIETRRAGFVEFDAEHKRFREPEVVYGSLEGAPVAIARWGAGATESESFLALLLNPGRMRSELIEVLIPSDAGLEVRAAGPTAGPWVWRLPGALRGWAISPTKEFVSEQRGIVLGQTGVSLGLTLLGLFTILGAMGVLVRLVRREVALAEMKSNFVADVSHELKTPLALIRMFAETLQSGRVPSEEKRREYHEIMVRESTRLTNLINNILDFARIDAGRKEYRLEPTDLAEVIRETYEAYRGQLEHHGFEHHLTVQPNLPAVEADRDAIAQALINLINNAVKYSDDERFVSIEVGVDTRRDRHGVLICVHDRGIGIKPDDRARIFEGFFRSPDGRVREQSGTGLGLSLVKHIVESHKGILDVESRLVKGTTFRIFLPGIAPQGTMSSDRPRDA